LPTRVTVLAADPLPLEVSTFAICEMGTRDHNDDVWSDNPQAAGRCVTVADGAGGHRGGAIAARVATDAIVARLRGVARWDDQALIAAVDAASRSVHERQLAARELRQMSCTIVLLCIDADVHSARWTHLGDSRLLFFRRKASEQLTRDHSLVQSLVDAGLAPKGGNGIVDRSLLYAAIGSENETRATVGSRTPLVDGDAFLLCTDGVWDTVPVPRIEQRLQSSQTVREWIEAVGADVRAAGKVNQDNYTALGVWIHAPARVR
jgi:PPM family protein phosphatase